MISNCLCGRRTLSTCVERILLEASSIHVHHEPFGTPYYWGEEAPSRRQADDTPRDASFAAVAADVFRAPMPAGITHVFSKDHAYYIMPHCLSRLADFTNGVDVRHSFIIRHPLRAIVSLYMKACVDNSSTGYTYFDPAEAGFVAMWDLYCHIEETATLGSQPAPIIDADDLLEDPEGVMSAYCAAVGLPFDVSMLQWGEKPVPHQVSCQGKSRDLRRPEAARHPSLTDALPCFPCSAAFQLPVVWLD